MTKYNDKTTIFSDPKETFIYGNIEKNEYIGYKNYKPKFPKINNSNESDLMLNVMMYGFYCHELNLYLDTHPFDDNAIKLFKKYRDEYMKYVEVYENKYGPIDLYNNDKVGNEYWEWLNV